MKINNITSLPTQELNFPKKKDRKKRDKSRISNLMIKKRKKKKNCNRIIVNNLNFKVILNV